MASIRKRVLPSGETRWLVDYRDNGGSRRAKMFETKRDAEAFRTRASAEVVAGTHVADSQSITLAEAAELWLAKCERDGLERSTVASYRVKLAHAKPLIGGTRLNRITVPVANSFVDELLKTHSRATARKVLFVAGAIFKDAMRRGLAGSNPFESVKLPTSKRGAARPEMPTKDELRAMFKHVDTRWKPFLVTAIFSGLRGSELRGLRWSDVDLQKGVLNVCQRLDEWNVAGPPKSEAGTRTIPLAPVAVRELKEWRLRCPRKRGTDGQPGELDLVFPNGSGKPERHGNILRRFLWPLQIKAGVIRVEVERDAKGEVVKDEDGKPKEVVKAKYSLHALRHAAAALFIEDGVKPKRLQGIMGHASIQMTFDVYGYLFESAEDDQAAVARIEARLLG